MRTKQFLFISFLLTFTFCTQNNIDQSIYKIIEEVKTKHAPDKRVAIFDISVKDTANEIWLIGETSLPEAKDNLLKLLAENGFNLRDEIALIPGKEIGENKFGVVNLSVINIRSKPNHRAELVTQALLGTPIKILKKESGFYLIQTPNEYIGWVDEAAVETMNEIELQDWKHSEKILYTKDFGFAYSEPNTKSKRVSDIVIGSILMKLRKSGNFYEVKYPDGRKAFVETKNCNLFNSWISKVNLTSKNVIQTAELFTGIPYLWGGTSVKGMDCSGFTKTVYFLNGLVLPRDASQQVNIGELVDTQNSFDNLLPGDLLFFGSKAKPDKKERITHVGIYKGNYEYIHASGRVKVNSFNEKSDNFSQYLLDRFIRAKRIINSSNENGFSTIEANKFYKGEFK